MHGKEYASDPDITEEKLSKNYKGGKTAQTIHITIRRSAANNISY